MLRAAMIACALLAATVPARACVPLESAMTYIAQVGATFEVFRDKEQTKRAAEFYAALPPVEPTPDADGFLLIRVNGKLISLVLTKGVGACHRADFRNPRDAEFAMIFIFGKPS